MRWEGISPLLELTVQQEHSIRQTFQDYEDQKHEALRTWKRNKGNEATYSSFITAAETISNMQLADNVRALLQKRLQHRMGSGGRGGMGRGGQGGMGRGGQGGMGRGGRGRGGIGRGGRGRGGMGRGGQGRGGMGRGGRGGMGRGGRGRGGMGRGGRR